MRRCNKKGCWFIISFYTKKFQISNNKYTFTQFFRSRKHQQNMDAFDDGDVIECFPDDPLQDVLDTATVKFLNNCNFPLKNPNTTGVRTKIRAPKKKQQIHTTCTICTLPFPNRSSLKLHQKTLHRRQFECYVCHKSFNRKSNLITHSRRYHTNIKPFRCKYCSLSFLRTTELLKHVIFHTGDTRNQCRQCKLVLSSQERLEKHKKTHAVSSNFQCHMCGALKKNLSSHMRLHAKVCDKKFNHSSLNQVTDVNKDKTDQTFFDCEICKKRFSRKSNFIAHLKRHNSNSNQTEHAKVKTHSFQHLYIHNGVRPYKCEYCGSDFTQRGLMKHIEKHKRSNWKGNLLLFVRTIKESYSHVLYFILSFFYFYLCILIFYLSHFYVWCKVNTLKNTTKNMQLFVIFLVVWYTLVVRVLSDTKLFLAEYISVNADL